MNKRLGAALRYAQLRFSDACAICGKPDPTGRHLARDHDHGNNRKRGLLCLNCNMGLGNFKDNPALLRKAADYLETHGLPIDNPNNYEQNESWEGC